MFSILEKNDGNVLPQFSSSYSEMQWRVTDQFAICLCYRFNRPKTERKKTTSKMQNDGDGGDYQRIKK
jgi:hypothetical protein